MHARTVQHKDEVRAWVRSMAVEAGAEDPDRLARSLTLLLDGGLAAGVLDGDPRTAEVAKQSARLLVDATCPRPGVRG